MNATTKETKKINRRTGERRSFYTVVAINGVPVNARGSFTSDGAETLAFTAWRSLSAADRAADRAFAKGL